MIPYLGIFPYEPRPVQAELMGLLSGAVESSRSALAEAGSGTGKTVCALVPALHGAARLGKRETHEPAHKHPRSQESEKTAHSKLLTIPQCLYG